jgi:hypothetical protein
MYGAFHLHRQMPSPNTVGEFQMHETTTILTLFALAAAWAVFAVGFPYAWIITSKISRLERDRKLDLENRDAISKAILGLIAEGHKKSDDRIEKFTEAFARNPRAFEANPDNYPVKIAAIQRSMRESDEEFQQDLKKRFDELFEKMDEQYQNQLDDINASVRPAIFLIGALGVVAVFISGYFILFR